MIYYAAIVISSATFEGYEIRTRYQMGNHRGTIQPFLFRLKTTVGVIWITASLDVALTNAVKRWSFHRFKSQKQIFDFCRTLQPLPDLGPLSSRLICIIL